MNLAEAINSRRSIRAFKSDPVPRHILEELLEVALRAPSWGNTQPWEFAVVTGPTLDRIKQLYVDSADRPPYPDLAGPRVFSDPFLARRRALGIRLFEIMGIGREDRDKRKQWELRGLRLFDAPCAIYIYTDRPFYTQDGVPNAYPVFDCGLIAGNITLLAGSYGLGTMLSMQSISYPDILKKELDIPDSKLIVLGIAVGYPDRENPLNEFQSERDSLDKMARWYGFGGGGSKSE
ncbi:MAG: nitroreductase [Dehalococcoidia bacterium]|nr:nitroreductase [Dehalococcoidia bacterium]